MRRLALVVLALGLAALLVSPIAAQQQKKGKGQGQGKGQFGQFGFGGGGGIGFLLINEGVQKELKMDEDQLGKVKEALQPIQEKQREAFAGLQDLSREERAAKLAELTTKNNEATLTALKDVLKPEQIKRLKQIELQQAGYRAFTRPDVQKELTLTSEQKGKITTISDDASKEERGLFGQGGGNFQEAAQKRAAIRKESMERISAVLTDAQKTSWKDLTGAAFEVQFRRPGG